MSLDDEASKLKDVKFWRKELYTDVIESGMDIAQTIKSHHGWLPEDMQFELVGVYWTLL